MTKSVQRPKLITFDGEARSGKGTVVQALKDYLRDEHGYKVMLIDAGQVFRCLVVAAANAHINLDNPNEIDDFLSDEKSAEACVQFVKQVYHMDKEARDELLYTNDVSANSAKVGGRPLAQSFKDSLLRKWMRDAATEGYQIVLLDGRALEETGAMLVEHNLCNHVAGFYFVCDPQVGAMRTLGFAPREYVSLNHDERQAVDALTQQVIERNYADRKRDIQPIREPSHAIKLALPVVSVDAHDATSSYIIDTSARMTKKEMITPLYSLIDKIVF